MKAFYFDLKASLNQRYNQKDYSSVRYSIEENKMKIKLIFTFLDI